ncbi:MAG: DinB family protein [Terriglobales bacterium]
MAETTAQYKQRVLSYADGQDALTLQAATPKKIAKLVAAASPAKLKRRPAPVGGKVKWSAAEILAHLADTEAAFAYRYRAIAGHPGIAIQGFDQDEWAERMGYARRPAAASLAAYLALRKFNLALLKSLSREQWQQIGNHVERGAESLEVIARMVAGHDLNHLRQLESLLRG